MTLLTHRRMLDAAVLVSGVWKDPSGDQVWDVRWFNRRGLDLGMSETILIKKKELGNWYVAEI